MRSLQFGGLLGAALVLCCASAAAQDVSVQASVEETTVGLEEQFVYTLEIEGAQPSQIETPEPPETTGLVLARPFPSTQHTTSIINGRMRRSIAYQWTFRPVREGRARINEAQVTIAGITYTTDPIALDVVPQSQRPQRRQRRRWPFQNPFSRPDPPDDEPPSADEPLDEKALFIRAVPSDTRVFQNEQVVVEYHLYFRHNIQLRQSRLADSWDAEGFWREDLEVEARPLPRSVVENGVRYHSIVLKRVAAFPTRSGTLEIDPLRIETEAWVPYRLGDPFEQFFSSPSRFQPIKLVSPPVVLDVRPLPDDVPDSFHGAVGAFRMAVEVDRSEVEVGEAVQVTVQLTGSGNLATLTAPVLDLPHAFEQYDPQVALDLDRGGARIEGTKTFTYLLVPRTNGTFALPPIAYTYFDPDLARYETLYGDPVTIQVTGTAPAAGATALASGLPVDDIAGLLYADAAWIPTGGIPLHRRTSAYAALLLPLLALLGLFAYRRYADRLARDVEYARGRRAHPVARKHLKQADRLLEDDEPHAFYEELERAVLSFVGNRLNIAEQGLTRQQLDAHLHATGVPPDTVRTLHRLLDECDAARFSPTRPDRAMMSAAHDRAAHLIVTLDAQLNQQPTPAA